MTNADQVSGRQIAAGRVLAGVSREILAKRANVELKTLTSIEARQAALDDPEAVAIRKALEEFGIRFIPENGGGAGVRLKFNSSEVRRIATLEGEGGIVGSDDV